jgi:hypothetical protein
MGVRHAGIIEQVIREAPSVAAGAKLLGAIARLDVPPELPVWKVVDALRWEQDVAIVRDAWVQRVRSSIPTDASGVYFAINGLNMPDGRGVELNCSSGHLPGWQAIDFIFNCEITCDDIPLPSLSRLSCTWSARSASGSLRWSSAMRCASSTRSRWPARRSSAATPWASTTAT